MNTLAINQNVIFRVPKFPFDARIDEHWSSLKSAIRNSSPEFYEQISEKSADEFDTLEKRAQDTVTKYFNRAKFRSTPYGEFASVGFATLTVGSENKVTISEQILHSATDWSCKEEIELSMDQVISEDLCLFTNSSYYRVANDIRYIHNIDGKFQIVSIEYDPVILDILVLCKYPIPFSIVKARLAGMFEDVNLEEYLSDLFYIQLLISSRYPNVLGEDYFGRINRPLQPQEKKYIIAETAARNGAFEKRNFKHLPQLAEILRKIVPKNISPEFEEFKSKFIAKYEQNEVLLLEALDPEIGVGYGDMATYFEDSEVTNLVKDAGTGNFNLESAQLKDTLYRQILGKGIQDTIALENLVHTSDVSAFPNSLSAICTLIDDRIILDRFGGASGTSLLCRFAKVNKEIYQHCLDIAGNEQSSNPDVLFFDIGYANETGVDNVNRRPFIYDYQLSILNYDTSEHPVLINDILVCHYAGEIVLRSSSLGKRLIPRLSSAYNYKRSDLPIFRFLMDLQHQGLHTNLTFRPNQVIADLSFYPRIIYKNVIVSPAIWQLDSKLFKGAIDMSIKTAILKEYIDTNVQTKYVKAGAGDQTLLLNTEVALELSILVSMIEKETKIYIEEALLPSAPAVIDAEGHPFLPQVIVTLEHQDQVIRSIAESKIAASLQVQKQWIPPGNDWLYFEIFTSTYRADCILNDKISQFLEEHKQMIRCWFFIRFNEQGDHLRLRLKLSDPDVGYRLISSLSHYLETEIQSAIVSDIRIRTYKKEVERYSARQMEMVETHFQKDSEFVIDQIKFALPDMDKYKLFMKLFRLISQNTAISSNIFINVLKVVAASFNKEFKVDNITFKELNRMFRELRKMAYPQLSEEANQLLETLAGSFISVLVNCPEAHRPKRLSDLLHMHINRLFNSNQRLHEMAIYNFCLMELKAEKYEHPVSFNSAG
jgi:thiopeptide-type bacteriocin biosynthesis protein